MSIEYDLRPATDLPEPNAETLTFDVPAQPVPVEHAPVTEAAPQLDHTAGGLPAIPLTVIAANSTVAGLSAAAVAGGPLTLAAVGAVAVAGVGAAVVRSRPKQKTGKTAARPAARATRSAAAGASSGSRASSARRAGTAASSPTGRGGARKATASAGARRAAAGPGGTRTAGKPRPAATGPKASAASPKTRAAGAGAGKGRVGQVKALRAARKEAQPTRKTGREQTTAARRQLRDTRRAARQQRAQGGNPASAAARGRGTAAAAQTRRSTTPGASRPGQVGRAIAAARHKTQTARDQAVTAARGARDQHGTNRRDRIRKARRNAAARAVMARRIAASGIRYGAQAAGRALLAAPVGLLGALTTPLGRKLGWAWLQQPGRRLFRRLIARARGNHLVRVANARTAYALATTTGHTTSPDQQPIADTVPRAPLQAGHAPDLTTGDPDMSEEIHSHFLNQSQELESAARAYEPGGMMHVRTTIRSMGPAIEHWANAFAALAEKADEDFPVGTEIGEGLDVIHRELRKVVEHAESLAEDFDRVHEADVNRLLNPRKSLEAERGWDISANEDFTE